MIVKCDACASGQSSCCSYQRHKAHRLRSLENEQDKETNAHADSIASRAYVEVAKSASPAVLQHMWVTIGAVGISSVQQRAGNSSECKVSRCEVCSMRGEL